MKRYLFLLLMTAFFGACDKDDFNNKNPFIPNYGFSKTFDTNLPGYSPLLYAGNSIYYGGSDAGARGLIIFNAGGENNYVAYDAACPNQEIADCSTMLASGSIAVCPCDQAEYNLFTGQAPGLEYPMKQYRVQVSGSVITVYN